MLNFIKRLLLVPLGFAAGVAVAAVVLVTLGSEQITQALSSDPQISIRDTYGLARQLLLLVSAATLIPAVLIIIVGEVARIRSAYYYVIGGGAALCAIPAMAWAAEMGTSTFPPSIVWQVFATAGFLGGLAYWAVAGRGA